MTPTRYNVDTSPQAEVRDRIADHLGFLLAKRWIRLHPSSGDETCLPHCHCVDNSDHPDGVEQSTRGT